MAHKVRLPLLAALVFGALLLLVELMLVPAAAADGALDRFEEGERAYVLSPIWGAGIRQWSAEIEAEATTSGLDPDFIAAVILAESNGNFNVVSRVGAVGLMGVMPSGPGLEWRPSPEALLEPQLNLSWGVAILTEIIRQSGGDIVAALAAYSAGWDNATGRVPQEYASQVLDAYGRAVAVRSGISPNIAAEWTVAAEINRGHIPVEPLILSEQPVSGLRKYGEHVVYNYTDQRGKAYFIKGFAVPLALVVPIGTDSASTANDVVDQQLLARLGMGEVKIDQTNARVIQACLPSLSRLRGRQATRWFAPSSCPSWHR